MEELVTLTNYDVSDDDNHRVTEWELGLPSVNDLTPLSQSLVPLDLATAFKITPEPHRTMSDVTRASHNTLSVIQQLSVTQPLNKPLLNSNGLFNGFISDGNEMNIETEENVAIVDVTKDGLDTDDSCARTSKRPRLVWTPQLHKRFVEVVAHLGVKNAVPKTIMQLMNVEGLTRENVASHLQKYRLYLKRMQGLSNEGVSSSDCLFDSTPVPQSVQESSGSGNGNGNGNGNGCSVSVPIPYPTQMVHMSNYHGFESHPFNVMVQQRDWSGNKFGSVSGYQQRMSNDK